jgi:hypothetical protein
VKFQDKNGRSWEPEINVVTIGRVRDKLKINLLELMLPNNTLEARLADPCLLVDILYLLCKEQAEAIGISDTDFGIAQTMDGIEQAWLGVLEGLVLFSPSGLRPAHQKVLEKAKKFQAMAEAKIKTMVETPEFDLMLDQGINRILNRQEKSPINSTGDALNSPALSASNQDAIPLPP